jgi:hypothetical protein
MDRRLLDYRPGIDAFATAPVAIDRDASAAALELQQAAELLERLDRGELETYLVELIDKSRPAPSSAVGSALAGLLGRAARRVWQPTSASRGRSAGPLFGLELEGLSHEDQAFELARHFLRFASEATRRAGHAAGQGSPQSAARRAAAGAAQTLAPGLLASISDAREMAGIWFRRGRQVIVLNP